MLGQDTSESTLAEYFAQFAGAESVRKRVYRDPRDCGHDDDGDADAADWRFTGSVFVTFADRRSAEDFMGGPAPGLRFEVRAAVPLPPVGGRAR